MFFSVESLISENMLPILLAQNLESYFVFAKTGHTGPYSEARDLSQGKTTEPLPNVQEADDFQKPRNSTPKPEIVVFILFCPL